MRIAWCENSAMKEKSATGIILERHLFLLQRELVVRLSDDLHGIRGYLRPPCTVTARRRCLKPPGRMQKCHYYT
jgi:hypothetical protein